MKFIQFYSMSTGYNNNGIPEPIESVGTEGVARLDGRLATRNWGNEANKHKQPHHVGYSVKQSHDGRFSNARTVKPYTSF